MLREISKAKYQLIAGDKKYEVVFSLGLKDALFELISDVYRKFLEMNPDDNLIPLALRTEFAEAQEKFQACTDDEERVALYSRVLELRTTMMTTATLLARQEAQRVQDGMLAAIRQFKYDIWAMLLSKRSLEGEVTSEVTVKDLKTDPVYAEPEVEDDLEQLLDVVLKITAERLKKSLRTQAALLEVVNPTAEASPSTTSSPS